MKKNRIIRLLGLTVSLAIAVTNGSPVVYATEIEKQEIRSFASGDEVNAYLMEYPSPGKRIILFSDAKPEDFYGANDIASYEGLWLLSYESEGDANAAYHQYLEEGLLAEMDESVSAYEEEETPADMEEASLPEASIEEVAEEQNQQVVPEDDERVVVAIIDTGVDAEDELLTDRLIGDATAEMTDANGHGTVMAEIIASQTSCKTKILPIAAFDENGNSTVAKVYFAIKEAITKEVDIINLSACGAGTSRILQQAISEAKQAGISVIVAAGNEAADVAGYMPANIEDAITISAVDADGTFAAYSNYGEGVDFAAIGCLVKDMGTEETADDVVYQGTSISAAYASAYGALVLEENPNCALYESFFASAVDLGEEGKDAYYGVGMLTRDRLVGAQAGETIEASLPEGDPEQLLSEEGEIPMHTAYTYTTGREYDENCYTMVGQTTVNGASFSNGHIHIGTNTSSSENAETICKACGYDPSGSWHQGTVIYSRNPADRVVFNNCTFTNVWTEFFFDAEYNNCTFTNCNFSNNASGNTIRFNHCSINASGYSGLNYTQAKSESAHTTYGGILGGLCTIWVLDGTTLNGSGAACAVSDCFGGGASQQGYVPYVWLLNGSRVYGGSVCAVDIWNNEGTNVSVYVDSSSQIDSSPIGIYNEGYAYVSSGTITGNTVGIQNYGTLWANGGEICNNATWGVENRGTAHIAGTGIRSNAAGGIYQDGAMYMNGNGAVDGNNVIYLTANHIIHVNGPLYAGWCGTILTAENDRHIGRQLIQLYEANSVLGQDVANRFGLAFDRVNEVHTMDVYRADGSRFMANGENVESAIRAGCGTDQNAPSDQVILSGKYYAGFEANLDGIRGLKVTTPYRSNPFYWGEKYLPDTPSHAFTTGEGNHPKVVVTMANGTEADITKSLSFLGWALDANETNPGRIYTTDQVRVMKGDFHWYGIWDASFDLYFDGNRQNGGDNYRLNGFHMDTPLPGNVGPAGNQRNYFSKADEYKASDQTLYDKNKETYVDMTVPYSYQGWSLRENARYRDVDVIKPGNAAKDSFGDVLGVGPYKAGVKWLVEKIQNGETKGFDEDGKAIVPIYVVWDQAPMIEAYDVYMTKNELDRLGEAPYWENVIVRDKEDGTLRNKVDVKLIDYNKEELKNIKGDRGGVSVTYQATDGAGNVTFYTIMVHVTGNTAITSRTPNANGSKRDTANYVRFIDRENYNKHATADGGMEAHSVWHKEPEYVELITTAFNCIDNKTSVISYELDSKNMQAIQQYNHDHFGEVLETSYRTNFYEQFLAPNVVSGSL